MDRFSTFEQIELVNELDEQRENLQKTKEMLEKQHQEAQTVSA